MASSTDLIQITDAGMYCQSGDFYIDPWQPVERAVITHAHSDHARSGSRHYLAAHSSRLLLQARLQPGASIQTLQYGETINFNAAKTVKVSLHPAGHVLGSAQVRVEAQGQVWVVSGDYKLADDRTCQPFEPVRCHVLVTESTFGLPIYRWQKSQTIFAEINSWWRANQQAGRCSVVFGYALGKAQRLLSGLEDDIGPIYTHGAVEKLTALYRQEGVQLPATRAVSSLPPKTDFKGSLILAPPSAQATVWMRRFGPAATAFASGWMRIRGARRRKSIDKGFVLSDHADWMDLNAAVEESNAQRVIVTHGYSTEIVRWLQEQGLAAGTFRTRFQGELSEVQPDANAEGAEDESDEP